MRIYYRILVLILASAQIMAQVPPDWTVNPHDYEYTMTVTAALEINGMLSTETASALAAFKGDECLGVVQATTVDNRVLYFLLIYSDSAAVEITFKSWSGHFDNIINLDQSLLFEISAGIGTVYEPFLLTGNNAISRMLAVDDQVQQYEDDTLAQAIQILANDTFNDTLPLFMQTSQSPLHGELRLYADQTVRYVPQENFFGQDSFQYRLWNDYAQDSAWVILDILGVNDRPFAQSGPDLIALEGSVIQLDGSASSDIEGDQLSFEWQASHAGVSFSNANAVRPIVRLPKLDSSATILVELRVHDGELYSDWDTLAIQVNTLIDVTTTNFEDLPQPPGAPITLTIEFPAYFNPVAVTLFYRLGGSSRQDSVPMSQVPGTTMLARSSLSASIWSAEIPAGSVTESGLSYYAEAIDSTGTAVTTDTHSIPVEIAAGTSSMSLILGSAYPQGIPASKWRLISIPTILDTSDIKTLVETPLGEISGEQSWRLYEWNGQQWRLPDSLVSGKGYWFQHRLDQPVDLVLGAGCSADLSGLMLDMQPGWNLLSSPYNFPIDAFIDSLKFSGFYAYGDYAGEGWGSQVDTLKPWAAYAVYNWADSVVALELNPHAYSPTLGKALAQAAGWRIKLSATNGTLSDIDNLVGRSSKASAARDIYDQAEPPTWGDYLGLSIKNPELDRRISSYASDIRFADDQVETWQVQLTAGQNISKVSLAFTTEGELCAGHVNIIVDIQQRTSIELGESHSIDGITLNANFGRTFKIVSGPESQVYRQIADLLAALPEQNLLAANYPNPFNCTTQIEFTLRDPASIRLDIFDIRGRHINTLVDDHRDMGTYKIHWSGINRDYKAVSSGLYLYRLSIMPANGGPPSQLTRKMVLIQ